MESEVLEKVRTEEINNLNIFSKLENYLESIIDLKVKDFFIKYNDSFHAFHENAKILEKDEDDDV